MKEYLLSIPPRPLAVFEHPPPDLRARRPPPPRRSQQPMPPPQPPPPPPAVERTTKTATIRNHVNVKKTSVSCSAANPFSPNKLKISFKFDANLPCHSSVFVLAIEDRSAPGNALSQKVNAPGSAPRRVAHEKGLGCVPSSRHITLVPVRPRSRCERRSLRRTGLSLPAPSPSLSGVQ